MPEVHAILSASSSKRWLNCTPSARLEQNFPNESSVYAEEGTAAHALGEYKLRKYLHERVRRPTSEFDNEGMEANTDIYAEFIITTVRRSRKLVHIRWSWWRNGWITVIWSRRASAQVTVWSSRTAPFMSWTTRTARACSSAVTITHR